VPDAVIVNVQRDLYRAADVILARFHLDEYLPDMTPAEARQLAAALTDAADKGGGPVGRPAGGRGGDPVTDRYPATPVRILTALARETEHDFPGMIAQILAQVAGKPRLVLRRHRVPAGARGRPATSRGC